MSSSGGIIQHRERARQINDFRKFKYGDGITPTDIDGFIDFNNTLFIWFELKYGNTELQYGQKLALERMCDVAWHDKKHAYVFVSKHNVADASTDIDAALTEVTLYRYEGQWRQPRNRISLKDAVDKCLKRHNMWEKYGEQC